MRIVVNDIAASAGGALTVLEGFYRYVRDVDEDNEWVFLLGSDLVEESERIRTVVLPEVKGSWIRRLAFDLVSGRRLVRSLKPDVLFSLQNTYTYGVGCPQVVYVHQSLPFQQAMSFSFLRRDERRLAVYQHLIGVIIKQSICRADRVISQSHWLRDAIVDRVGIANDSVVGVPLDLDDLSAFAFRGELDPGAFCYPTSDQSYKNNDCIYAACALLREQSVADFKVTMTISDPPSDPNVDPIGRVPRAQVLEMLSRSTLVFPSLIETYGLPLAEARALGAVVLAADLPYAREVLNGYVNAYYFDPKSPSQLASLMGKVIAGSITRVPNADFGEALRVTPQTPAWAEVIKILEHSAQLWGRQR